eukprot:5307667-Alexandrium_andersonii.AAC.2
MYVMRVRCVCVDGHVGLAFAGCAPVRAVAALSPALLFACSTHAVRPRYTPAILLHAYVDQTPRSVPPLGLMKGAASAGSAVSDGRDATRGV